MSFLYENTNTYLTSKIQINKEQETRRKDKALKIMKLIVKKYPKDFLIIKAYATSLVYWDEYKKALVWAKKALAINPNDYFMLRCHGISLFYLKKYEDAIMWMKKTLSIKPNDDLICEY